MKFVKQLFFLLLGIVILLTTIATAFAQKEANVTVGIEKVVTNSNISVYLIIILLLIFIILLLITYYILKYVSIQQKKRHALRERAKPDADESDYKEEHHEEMSELSIDSEVDKYLKEDERTVINILRQRGGICSQATLRIAGNFSKATLSRLLKELEDRNVIKKEKRGKKNLVILK